MHESGSGNKRSIRAGLSISDIRLDRNWDLEVLGPACAPTPRPPEVVCGLTRAGFGVMRSKKGVLVGSTGRPNRDVDFQSEVSLFYSMSSSASASSVSD